MAVYNPVNNKNVEVTDHKFVIIITTGNMLYVNENISNMEKLALGHNSVIFRQPVVLALDAYLIYASDYSFLKILKLFLARDQFLHVTNDRKVTTNQTTSNQTTRRLTGIPRITKMTYHDHISSELLVLYIKCHQSPRQEISPIRIFHKPRFSSIHQPGGGPLNYAIKYFASHSNSFYVIYKIMMADLHFLIVFEERYITG